jgi:hypothetical protein
MTEITRSGLSVRLPYGLYVICVAFFAFALVLPIVGTFVLEGSNFARLERDPKAAAIFTAYLLCLPFLRKCPRWAIMLIALAITGFAFYRDHTTSMPILLGAAAIVPPRQK